MGRAVVMGGPQDFPDHGIRCFLLIDPNGIAMNVLAPLNAPTHSKNPLTLVKHPY